MTRTYLAAAAALTAWLGAAGPAAAQGLGGPRVGSPPPAGYSPYLNLIRGRNTPAVNYYGLVRPQQAFQNALFGLQAQGQSANLTPVIGGSPDGSDLPGTGLPVQFMNHRAFFLNHGAQTAPNRGAGLGSGVGQSGAARSVPPSRGR